MLRRAPSFSRQRKAPKLPPAPSNKQVRPPLGGVASNTNHPVAPTADIKISQALRGWLKKRHTHANVNVFNKYGQRFVWVDDEQGTLCYAKTDTSAGRERTCLQIKSIAEVTGGEGRADLPSHSIVIRCTEDSPTAEYVFGAEDREEQQMWITQLAGRAERARAAAAAEKAADDGVADEWGARMANAAEATVDISDDDPPGHKLLRERAIERKSDERSARRALGIPPPELLSDPESPTSEMASPSSPHDDSPFGAARVGAAAEPGMAAAHPTEAAARAAAYDMQSSAAAANAIAAANQAAAAQPQPIGLQRPVMTLDFARVRADFEPIHECELGCAVNELLLPMPWLPAPPGWSFAAQPRTCRHGLVPTDYLEIQPAWLLPIGGPPVYSAPPPPLSTSVVEEQVEQPAEAPSAADETDAALASIEMGPEAAPEAATPIVPPPTSQQQQQKAASSSTGTHHPDYLAYLEIISPTSTEEQSSRRESDPPPREQQQQVEAVAKKLLAPPVEEEEAEDEDDDGAGVFTVSSRARRRSDEEVKTRRRGVAAEHPVADGGGSSASSRMMVDLSEAGGDRIASISSPLKRKKPPSPTGPSPPPSAPSHSVAGSSSPQPPSPIDSADGDDEGVQVWVKEGEAEVLVVGAAEEEEEAAAEEEEEEEEEEEAPIVAADEAGRTFVADKGFVEDDWDSDEE